MTRSRSFFEADPHLARRLRAELPAAVHARALPLLERAGAFAAGRVDALAAEADRNPPRLERADRYGDRVDRVEPSRAYRELESLAYGELGLVSGFYGAARARWEGHGHRVKFALGELFAQGEQGLFCPICMTDGAARLAEKFAAPPLRERLLERLTAPADERFWSGAMFLTERAGGSDVGAAETVARPAGDGEWTLHGFKWFCSNASAGLAMVLARPEGAAPGTRGLGLFAMPLRTDDDRPNGLRVERLKDKLGTRSMATGELTLDGARAWLVGDPGRGFVQMAEMLNLSRLYNSVASTAILRRCVHEARAWCGERVAFGRTIAGFPLVQRALCDLEVEARAARALVARCVRALDAVDAGRDPDGRERKLVRLVTPIAKLHTAQRAVWASRETMELLGGNGYIEDWPVARLYRDAMVLPIWEGTTFILSLDAFRSMSREETAPAFDAEVRGHLEACGAVPALAPVAGRVGAAFEALAAERAEVREAEGEGWTLRAPDWCQEAGRVLSAALLLDEARTDGTDDAVASARWFVERTWGDARRSARPPYEALFA